MYKDHFRLQAMPFSIAPDPSYFFLSNQHRDALTHLRHALEGAPGVVLLTGEIGAGKTTVCRRLLADLPSAVNVALIYNPRLTPQELLEALCQEFGIAGAVDGASPDELARRVAEHVAAAGRAGKTSLLIIDEAQNLGSEVLEQLRRLLDANRSERETLRIVLIGQPELNEILAQQENARFNEAISVRFHLGPLERSDVEGYVRHRLSVAGGKKQLFPRRLMQRLHRMSQGIPRVINLICDRALLGAFVLGKETVTARILEEARAEAVGQDAGYARWRRLKPMVIGSVGLLTAGACLAVALRSAPPDKGPLQLQPQTDVSVADLDPMDPSDWPDGMAGKRSEALAFAALLKRWNVANADNEPPCGPRMPTGLKCVQGRDELEDLRRLNMPAVLQLMDRRGRQMQVALVQLQKDQAVLQLGDTVRRVPVSALESQWTHQYTVLWRPPPQLQGSIAAGSGGAPVEWLRERIARLKGLDAGTLPTRLEGPLKAQLQAFQTLEGLRVTGAGDLRTLVVLSGRTEPDAPALDAAACRR